MKYLFYGLIVMLFLCTASCKKTSFIAGTDALLTLSTDTLHFDTVFTTTGSITQSFKIFNQNEQKLRLSSIKLMGGASSAFKINVDGTSGEHFSGIEMEPNDSIYVFVSVTINANTADLPFLVRDSILIDYNGNEKFLQLEAYGQNANFYRNRRITKDSTWNNNLPFVILGGVTVDSNVTLTINKGCRIYCHADAPVIINGTLRIKGEANDHSKVVFQGDRIDEDYKDFPGSWPGLYFTRPSKNSVLEYAVIKNAYQGIVTELPAENANPKVSLHQCIIDNMYDAGILSVASSIRAVNCLVSNCGNNIAIVGGGSYSFAHCTVVTYGTFFVPHKNPALFVTDAYNEVPYPLNAFFRNCIFYGDGGAVENEVQVVRKAAATSTNFTVRFENVLYKNKDEQPAANFNNVIKNASPLFDSIDVTRRYFNFRLKTGSPAINSGAYIGVLIDLDGKQRPTTGAVFPDLGCYEQ